LFNADDEHHIDANKTAERIANLKWYTTSFVVQEIFWMLSKRKSFSDAYGFNAFLAIANASLGGDHQSSQPPRA
jgi:predicted nucleic acid-binding protein